MNIEQVSQAKVFNGWHKQFTHQSKVLNCAMRFAIFLPPNASKQHSVPVLYWLSGLTCTDENFMQKAGAFRLAAQLGIAIVAPDTSPRGEGVADDIEGAYDLGLGAGFYLNATQAPWHKHYHMYDYVTAELPSLIEEHFPVSNVKSISGHSMGGHGALTIGLKNAENYRSISAFSPICNPTQVPWGKKAFSHYLGADQTTWQQYDASILLKEKLEQEANILPILIDQGTSDSFLAEQLKPESLLEAIKSVTTVKTGYPILEMRMQPEYDHSYFFISSFIEDHLQFHAQYLFEK